MHHEITQRELRNDSGRIMNELDMGHSFLVTRNGVPVGELRPVNRRMFVAKSAIAALFTHVPPTDAKKFRADLDEILDQDPTPRG
jgi:antitoxin (DNA-binding transcriptional repressor) of toxin-antitoxin stability system